MMIGDKYMAFIFEMATYLILNTESTQEEEMFSNDLPEKKKKKLGPI